MGNDRSVDREPGLVRRRVGGDRLGRSEVCAVSKARQKGTAYENRVRDHYLRSVWPSADRAPLRGTSDVGDFDGTPLVVEAKKRNAWRLGDWIRTTTRKALLEGRPWIIVFAGDKRVAGLEEDYVCMEADFFFRLLVQAKADSECAQSEYGGKTFDEWMEEQ